MKLDLTNKIAVVTGASKGIGLAIVQKFVEEGAKVIAISRSLSPELSQLVDGSSVVHKAMDVTSTLDTDNLSGQLQKVFGNIDILVNNVGAIDKKRGKGFLATSNDEWEELYNLNFFSIVRMTQAVLPHMIKQKSGSIINISSINAKMPELMLPIYGTTKAAMNNLTKVLAEEFGPKNIRVNSISPGPVSTPLWQDPTNGLAKDIATAKGLDSAGELMDKIPELAGITLGQFANSIDIANLTLFLSSERASMITGTDYIIDGGLLKTI